MKMRELVYTVKLETKGIKEQIEKVEKQFDGLKKKIESVESSLKQLGDTGSNVFKQFATAMAKARGDTGNIAKSVKEIKDGMNGIKTTKLNSQFFSQDGRATGVGIRGGRRGLRSPGGGQTVQEGALGTTQFDPTASKFQKGINSFMTGLMGAHALESLPHFLGAKVGAVAQKMVQMSIQRMEEASKVFEATLEARAVSRTLLSNRAVAEGIDADVVMKKAQQNANEFARNTIFSERQALIAQGAMAEGGMSTEMATTTKNMNTLMNATIARYNKINVSEGQIQRQMGMISRFAQTGKAGNLRAQVIGFGGEEFLQKIEQEQNIQTRFDMIMDLFEKNIGGLAEKVKQENQTMFRSIIEQNRTEEINKGRMGEIGVEFQTRLESIYNNVTPLLVKFGEALLGATKIIDKYTMSEEDAIDKRYKFLEGRMTEEEKVEYAGLTTSEEQQQFLAKKSADINMKLLNDPKTTEYIRGLAQIDTTTLKGGEKAKFVEDLGILRTGAQNTIDTLDEKEDSGLKLTEEEKISRQKAQSVLGFVNTQENQLKQIREGDKTALAGAQTGETLQMRSFERAEADRLKALENSTKQMEDTATIRDYIIKIFESRPQPNQNVSSPVASAQKQTPDTGAKK